MIGEPYNDHECLGALTQEAFELVDARNPALVAFAKTFADTAALRAWFRSLPQRDDDGDPTDGPKIVACRPAQRLGFLPEKPNCFERAFWYLILAELIDPRPERQLRTVSTRQGMHTLPYENGRPVILDPLSHDARPVALEVTRNAAASSDRAPTRAVEWIGELAGTGAARFVDGVHRVRNGYRAIRGLLLGQPLCVADVHNVAFMLALAERESAAYGPAGPRVVQTMAHALDRLDQLAADRLMRNALKIGGYTVAPKQLLGSIARVGGRLGGKVGLEAVKLKLAAMGISPPVLSAIDEELQREGLTLGPLAEPPAMLGSLASLTPEALGGRWLASKL